MDTALIDGEAVVFRDDGRSAFVALLAKRGGAQPTHMAFDLLRLNGDDLRLRPLEARREALKRLVPLHRGFDGFKFNGGLGGPRARREAQCCGRRPGCA